MGPVFVTGVTFDRRVAWSVAEDPSGWTHTVLAAGLDPRTVDPEQLDRLVREAVATDAQPSTAVRHVLQGLRELDPNRTPRLAHVRVAPSGRFAEVLNVSLGTVLLWDPQDGLHPLEAVADHGVAFDRRAMEAERITLREGAALILASDGVLSRHADWGDLRRFTNRIGLDPIGGDLACIRPAELSHLLQAQCAIRPRAAAAGMVMLGMPRPTVARA